MALCNTAIPYVQYKKNIISDNVSKNFFVKSSKSSHKLSRFVTNSNKSSQSQSYRKKSTSAEKYFQKLPHLYRKALNNLHSYYQGSSFRLCVKETGASKKNERQKILYNHTMESKKKFEPSNRNLRANSFTKTVSTNQEEAPVAKRHNWSFPLASSNLFL
jgi:hypothetical protein